MHASEAISTSLVTDINRSMGTLLQTDHVAVGDHLVDDLSGDANLCQSLQSNWSKAARPNDFGCLHDGTKKVAGWGEEKKKKKKKNKTEHFIWSTRVEQMRSVFELGRHNWMQDGKEHSKASCFINILAILVSFRKDRVRRQTSR